MGKVFSFVKSIFSPPKVKATPPAPVKTQETVKDVEDDKQSTKAVRASLYATSGGAKGEELSAVKRRDTLLGN